MRMAAGRCVAEITCEKECIGPTATQGGKEAKMGDAYVCASSTTAKSNTTFLLAERAAASAVNSCACVISLRACNPARTRSKIDH